MIIIATNNNKEILNNILTSLENNKIDKKISIIDTKSSDYNSLLFLEKIDKEKPYNLDINIYQTPYSGYDSGAYIYAIKNIISDKYYFLQDSLIIKSDKFFSEIDNKITTTIVPLITFQENYYRDEEQKIFCRKNFGSDVYKKGIFGPSFSILRSTLNNINFDSLNITLPYNKNTQEAMERGWSVLFENNNITIDPLEGEKDDDKLFNDGYLYFKKELKNRK